MFPTLRFPTLPNRKILPVGQYQSVFFGIYTYLVFQITSHADDGCEYPPMVFNIKKERNFAGKLCLI